MDQLPIPLKFMAVFAVVIAMIMVTAWAIGRLSKLARGSEQPSAQTAATPGGPRWDMIALSLVSSHLFVFVFASKPDVPAVLKIALLALVVVGLMMTLRREFAKR